MPQQHLDRLTSIDASFLHQEGPASHMHIGGVLIFEGPPPAFEDLLDHIRGRLHLVPRYRQKLANPPLESGRPLWVDDPTFNLEYHIRHTALPSPGSEEQLFRLASRIASQPLDHSKPLWEMWLVEGLDDYKQVKNALGGTVNDVVLTVVAGSVARWLRTRGVRTEGLEMRALVPVSVRTSDHRGSLGNQLTVMRGPLPVYINDPVARLRVVRRAMDGLKESKQAVGAAALARVNNLAPPTILAQASRLNFSTRLFNLIVTNIPGPQLPLYLLGRELEDLFPIAFLPKNHALAVAIMSYNGRVEYGLLADYDALPDVDVIAEGLDSALEELLEAARTKAGRAPSRRRATATPNGGPVTIMPSGRRAKRGPAADMRARHARSSRAARKRPQR